MKRHLGDFYAYAHNNTFVVFNRADEVIHTADTFKDAHAWAEANEAAIDEPLTRPEYLAKDWPSFAAFLVATRMRNGSPKAILFKSLNPDLFTVTS